MFLEVAEMRTHPVYTGRYTTTHLEAAEAVLNFTPVLNFALALSLQQLEPTPGPGHHPLPPPRLLQHQNLQRHRGASAAEAEVRMAS